MTENDLMLTSILNCRRVDLAAQSRILTIKQKSQLNRMKERRAQGEPLQYILGNCEFMGIPLSVDERVLIPRPETEIMVKRAIQQARTIQSGEPLRVLDIGTGSGNIAIAFAKNILNSEITAIDIHDGAVTLAKENSRENGVEQRIQFLQRDLGEYFIEAVAQGLKFDIIISNPPYIPTAQMKELPVDVQKEPQRALDGGGDGLHFMISLIHNSHRILNPGGFLLLEIGDDQSDHVEGLFNQYSQYQNMKFYKDYVGTLRIVVAKLKMVNSPRVPGTLEIV